MGNETGKGLFHYVIDGEEGNPAGDEGADGFFVGRVEGGAGGASPLPRFVGHFQGTEDFQVRFFDDDRRNVSPVHVLMGRRRKSFRIAMSSPRKQYNALPC